DGGGVGAADGEPAGCDESDGEGGAATGNGFVARSKTVATRDCDAPSIVGINPDCSMDTSSTSVRTLAHASTLLAKKNAMRRAFGISFPRVRDGRPLRRSRSRACDVERRRSPPD